MLIKSSIKNGILQIKIPNQSLIEVDVKNAVKESLQVILFKNEVSVFKITHSVNSLVSSFLNKNVSLVVYHADFLRSEKEKYNAKPNDVITLSDVAPIHLVNKSSEDYLNVNLKEEVTTLQFRPNIVVSGIPAFEEENWKYVKIGTCEFEVITKTQRCSLITIDINTANKIDNQEPLRTISTLKSDRKANFGIYLVPRKLGTITLNDGLGVVE